MLLTLLKSSHRKTAKTPFLPVLENVLFACTVSCVPVIPSHEHKVVFHMHLKHIFFLPMSSFGLCFWMSNEDVVMGIASVNVPVNDYLADVVRISCKIMLTESFFFFRNLTCSHFSNLRPQ